jgi:hypothetical protein
MRMWQGNAPELARLSTFFWLSGLGVLPVDTLFFFFFFFFPSKCTLYRRWEAEASARRGDRRWEAEAKNARVRVRGREMMMNFLPFACLFFGFKVFFFF